MRAPIFEDLFVLELANNHWGKLDRGLKIIADYGQVVRFNGVRAALKLQFRDVASFIHKDFRDRSDIRYIKKTLDTQMSWDSYAQLLKATRRWNMITMATPFDEVSVDKCVELGVQIIKIASSDIKDWFLMEKIATTRKPVAISTGGSSLRDMDDVVTFFNRRNIPLAINHCVSLYPSEDGELELNQIDFLVDRYPENVIGFSTHEYRDWRNSIMIAYAKGRADLRTPRRHRPRGRGGLALLLAARAGGRLVHGLPQGPGNVRRARHGQARAARARGPLPRCPGARGLCQARPAGGPCADRCRPLPRRPASARPDFLPRADEGRGADEPGGQGWARHVRQYRQSLYGQFRIAPDDREPRHRPRAARAAQQPRLVKPGER